MSLRHINLSANLYQRRIKENGYGPGHFSTVPICLRSEVRGALCTSSSHWAEAPKTPAGDNYLLNEDSCIKPERASLPP